MRMKGREQFLDPRLIGLKRARSRQNMSST